MAPIGIASQARIARLLSPIPARSRPKQSRPLASWRKTVAMSACWPSLRLIVSTPAGPLHNAPANGALFMRVRTSSACSPMCRRIAESSACSTDTRQHWHGSARLPAIASDHSASNISVRPGRWRIFIATMASTRMPSLRRRRRSRPAARSGISRRCLERSLHHRSYSEQHDGNGKDDDPNYNRADDHGDRVNQGVIRRRPHQCADAGVQQVQAVKAENRQKAQRRQNIEHARDPGRRWRVGRHFHRAFEILARAERACEKIDDIANDKDAYQGQHIDDDRPEKSGPDADTLPTQTNDRRADESADRRNRRYDHDVVCKKKAGVAGLGVNFAPFGLRLQQDPLDSVEDIHDTPPFIAG